MASHPMTGQAVGERVCKGSLLKKCTQTVTLLVAKTGAIYYNCPLCGAKHFYHKSETADFLAGTDTPANENAPVEMQEPANENTIEKDDGDELFSWG